MQPAPLGCAGYVPPRPAHLPDGCRDLQCEQHHLTWQSWQWVHETSWAKLLLTLPLLGCCEAGEGEGKEGEGDEAAFSLGGGKASG